ncbi:MAG: NAD-dependent epimerase/dehydratase family protein [Proteobacteria bacterium]|nr:NAD-dependent epimerase/dehydratase family protein [Pseudomonadota bacterium]
MRYAIIGGGGFIGSAIVERLLRDGHALRILERPRVQPWRSFEAGEAVEWVAGDLMSTHDVEAAIDDVDAVVHLASSTLPKSSNDDPAFDVQTNLVPSLRLLDAMVRRRVGRIVFISSGGAVYGPARTLPIDESHPTEPLVSYAIVKLAIEKYMRMYQRLHGVRGIVLRVANPYGERQRPDTAQGAVGVFLHHALRGEAVELWGDGSVARDYLHVADVADAFARALAYDGSQSVFNIGSGTATRLDALLAAIGEALGHPIACTRFPARAIDVPANALDSTLAQRELGWSPKLSLRDGLARTIDWMRTQPDYRAG